jgi:hypothetical protein
MRFKVQPRDVPADEAAKRLGIGRAVFDERLPNLIARGFPKADPDTGNFDLAAIDRWCDMRHQHLFNERPIIGARDAGDVVGDRIAAMRSGHA